MNSKHLFNNNITLSFGLISYIFLQPDLGLAPDVVLGEAIGMNEWMSFIDREGKVQNSQELKKLIHHGVGDWVHNYPLAPLR